jgi:hypothetical protein
VRHSLITRLLCLTFAGSYITECIDARSLREPQPKFYALTSAATAIELAKDFDQWGDPDGEDMDLDVCFSYDAVHAVCLFSFLKLGPARFVASRAIC